MSGTTPDAPDVVEQALDPAVIRVWSLVGAAAAAPLALGGLVAAAASGGHPVGWLVLVVGLAAAVLLATVGPRWRYRHFRWGVDAGVLRVRSGILFRTEAAVPVFRIQHIDLEQGPLDRWAGLQQLTVHTAAPQADVTLPGVAADEAVAVRARLLELSRAAVVSQPAGASDAV